MANTDDLILVVLYSSPLHVGFKTQADEHGLNRKRRFGGEMESRQDCPPEQGFLPPHRHLSIRKSRPIRKTPVGLYRRHESFMNGA